MQSFFEICPPVPEKTIFEGFLSYQVFSEETFEYYGNIHVYCPGVGAYKLMGAIFFRINNIQSYCAFPARLSL